MQSSGCSLRQVASHDVPHLGAPTPIKSTLRSSTFISRFDCAAAGAEPLLFGRCATNLSHWFLKRVMRCAKVQNAVRQISNRRSGSSADRSPDWDEPPVQEHISHDGQAGIRETLPSQTAVNHQIATVYCCGVEYGEGY